MVIKFSKDVVNFHRLHLSDTVNITLSILEYVEFSPSDDNINIFYSTYVKCRPSIFFKVLHPKRNLIAHATETLFPFRAFGFKLRSGDRLF
jgi:hypothetical protein